MLFRLIQETMTVEQCLHFLQERGILRSRYCCEACSVEMRRELDKTKCDECRLRCPRCRATKSIRSGTILEHSKLSLREFIWLGYFWSHQTSNKSICEHLGMAEHTVIDWLNLFREVCSWKLMQLNPRIGGVGKVVQIDESLIYRAKYNIGHALLARQKWVMGFYDVERRMGFVRMLEDRSADSLLALITEHVEPGSEIHTDSWTGYRRIPELPVNPPYTHLMVNHSENFVDPMSGCHTNNVEAFWSSLKAKFKHMNGTSIGNTASYLDEHEYKQRLK